MTEDDTFKALTRPHVSEMLGYYKEWANGISFEPLETLCKRHGWTWQEFSVAGAQWLEKHRMNSDDRR